MTKRTEHARRALEKRGPKAAALALCLALPALAWFLSTKKAVVYTVLLTNLYLVVGLLAAFLGK